MEFRLLLLLLLACGGCRPERADHRPRETAPAPAVSESIEGIATWYKAPHGSLADRRAPDTGMTAAHPTFPIGRQVRVTRLDDGREVTVEITDRGIPSRSHIDLSKKAAREIGMVKEGRINVRIELLAEE